MSDLTEAEKMAKIARFGFDRPGNECRVGCHIFWFDVDDADPMQGWYTCRSCGWNADLQAAAGQPSIVETGDDEL